MIAAQYTNSLEPTFFSGIANQAKSFVEFHSYDSPLLNQWHHLISLMRKQTSAKQWVTLINPPFIPNDKYLKEIGLGDHYVRVLRLDGLSSESVKYIRQCVQNGKSSVVAIWANSTNELPEVLLNDSPLGCQALVFSNNSPQTAEPQLEMAF